MGHAGHLGVLLGEPHERVDKNQTDIRTFHRHLRTQDAVLFNDVLRLAYPTFAPQPGRVDENKLPVPVFDRRVNGVTRGAGDGGDNGTFLPCDTIDQRGFSHVGLTDDGPPNGFVLCLLLRLVRKVGKGRVEQIARAVAVYRRHLDRIPQTEVVKFIKFRRRLA